MIHSSSSSPSFPLPSSPLTRPISSSAADSVDYRTLPLEHASYCGCSYLPPFPCHDSSDSSFVVVELLHNNFRTVEIPSCYQPSIQRLLRSRIDLQRLKRQLEAAKTFYFELNREKAFAACQTIEEIQENSERKSENSLENRGFLVPAALSGVGRVRHRDEFDFHYDPSSFDRLILFDYSPRTLCRFSHPKFSRDSQAWFKQIFPWEFPTEMRNSNNLANYRRCHHFCGCSHNLADSSIHPYFGISPVSLSEFSDHVADADCHPACQPDWSCFSFLTKVYQVEKLTGEVIIDCSGISCETSENSNSIPGPVKSTNSNNEEEINRITIIQTNGKHGIKRFHSE